MRTLPDKLFRFTKREFAEQFIHLGRIRFSHAKTFKDESLSLAQYDDERTRHYSLDESGKKYYAPDQSGKLHHVLGMTIFMTNGDGISPRDYYMCCLSLEFDSQMYEKFQADACIVLNDTTAFFQRLADVIRSQFPEGGSIRAFPVEYYDPTVPPIPRSFNDYLFLKKSSFAYQAEFRIAIEVSGIDPYPDHLFIDLGDLRDISSIREYK